MHWDEYFMNMANLVSTKSKDRSTKVGCVIVGPNHEIRTTGYNGFCRGIDDDVNERHERPEKYFWAEHAERNALYNAARNGISMDGCDAYVTMVPCADCTRGLIQSGIKRVVVKNYDDDTSEKWLDSFTRSNQMMSETGVDFVLYCNKN